MYLRRMRLLMTILACMHILRSSYLASYGQSAETIYLSCSDPERFQILLYEHHILLTLSQPLHPVLRLFPASPIANFKYLICSLLYAVMKTY